MFKLSKDIVKKVINGKVDYNNLPCDASNEKTKGYRFEDQARINLDLEKSHKAICSALEEICKRDACVLYANKSGKIKEGWVCREYQVDFPEASFDSRLHLAFVGVDCIDIPASIENLQELKQRGAEFVCLGCNSLYMNKPTRWYEDGHGGRDLEMCACGSDLFDGIDSFVDSLQHRNR